MGRAGAAGAALALALGTAGRATAQSTPTRPTSPLPAPIGGPDRVRARGDTLPRTSTPDTTRRGQPTVGDSLRGTPDSLKTPKVRRDSIQAPLTRGELPTRGVVAGPAYYLRGDTVLASGAQSVAEILERVPGVTVFRTGYFASAQTAAYLGDFRRVRIFRDGVELDPIDPRNGGVLDLTDVQVFQAEEVSVEPTAGEVRVFIRTRAPVNTTPQTRVDIFTGDQQTNLYRAFFGKRLGNGGLAQFALQQLGTGRNYAFGSGGDVTSALVRLGWARKNRSVDVLLTRVDRRRNRARDPFRAALDSTLTSFSGRRDEAYLRLGYGDPDQGVWAQAIANVLRFNLNDPQGATYSVNGTTAKVFQDTSAYRNQFILTGGFTRFGVRFTATERYRSGGGVRYHAPSVRAAYERGPVMVSALAERVGLDSTTRLDVSGRLNVLPRVAVLGGFSSTTGDTAVVSSAGGTRRVARAELAAQLGRTAWASVGRIAREGGTFLPPRIYAVVTEATSGPPVAVQEKHVGGTVATLRGEVLPFIYADAYGTVWDNAGVYRPKYQAHAELRFASNFLRRYPTGEFGVTAALSDEYRSRTLFPLAPVTLGGSPVPTYTAAGNSLGFQLEIRLQRAVISYRNPNILGRVYQQVPGTYPARSTNYYGVRWEFSN